MRKTSLFLLLFSAAVIFADDLSEEGKRWWSHVQFLADDKLEGRNTGSAGHHKAAEYIAEQFKAAGAKPAGTNGYLQPIKFNVRQIEEEKSSLALVRDGKAEPLKLGEDAYFGLRTEPARHVEADAVFVGYGLQIPEMHIDDLAGIDLHGKIAVYIAGAPSDVPGPLAAHSQSGAVRAKALREAGAIGTASFANPKRSDIPWERAKLARFMPAMSIADPALQEPGSKVSIVINALSADKFLAGTGHTGAEILALDDAHQAMPHFALKVRIRANPEFKTSEVESENVVGMVPGSDPKLKDEYVVISAHLDHIGVGAPINGDPIYNGAMDNASGTASLIEIAKELSKQKLKRSLLLLAVTGEEKGLLGSKYFANHPTVKPGSIVADVNLDMFLPIIPLHAVTTYGADESDLGPLFKQVAERFDIKVLPDREPHRNIFIRSDQYNFILKGVPSLSVKFAADAGTPEEKTMKDWITNRYHAPSDDLNQPVNIEGAAKFNRLLAAVAKAIADRPERPHWYPTSFFSRFAKT
jgi:hypothetical protein